MASLARLDVQGNAPNRVLAAVASRARDDGTGAKPSARKISSRQGISREYVDSAIDALAKGPVLDAVAPGPRQPKRLTINIEVLIGWTHPDDRPRRSEDAPDAWDALDRLMWSTPFAPPKTRRKASPKPRKRSTSWQTRPGQGEQATEGQAAGSDVRASAGSDVRARVAVTSVPVLAVTSGPDDQSGPAGSDVRARGLADTSGPGVADTSGPGVADTSGPDTTGNTTGNTTGPTQPVATPSPDVDLPGRLADELIATEARLLVPHRVIIAANSTAATRRKLVALFGSAPKMRARRKALTDEGLKPAAGALGIAESLHMALEAVCASPHHRGQNESGAKYLLGWLTSSPKKSATWAARAINATPVNRRTSVQGGLGGRIAGQHKPAPAGAQGWTLDPEDLEAR